MTLSEEGYEKTAALLTSQMDHELIKEKGSRFRYSTSGNPGDYVDVLCNPDALRGEEAQVPCITLPLPQQMINTAGSPRQTLAKWF